MLFFEKQGKLVCGWEERWQEPHAPYIKRYEYVIQRKTRIPFFFLRPHRNKEQRFGIYSLPSFHGTQEHQVVRHYKLASFIKPCGLKPTCFSSGIQTTKYINT